MKIGFDAKRAFLNNTGLGNYSRFVISGLAEYFPEDDYFLYSPGIQPHQDIKKTLLHDHIHAIDLGPNVLGKAKRAIGFDMEGLDIFHGLSNELPFFTLNKNVKRVVSIHDLLFLRYPNFYPRIDRTIYKVKTNRACQQSDLIIAISEQTKQDLMNFLQVPEEKIKVHYQSCHPLFLVKHTTENISFVKNKYGLSKPYILQVGTLEERKNALLTLKAYNMSPFKEDYTLVLLGKQTPYCELLYDFVKKNGLSENVTFIHTANFEDFPVLYQGSSLSVYPSLFEGFGIPILEAMYSGTPVITSTGSCFHEVGGDAVLYANPLDEHDLCKKIDLLLSAPRNLAERKEKGLARAERFSTKRLIGELNYLYKSLI